ncbi:hypothetical protein FAES_3411 [Fibrella aestuarina BUZ 2]|uniref:DoxX family protein n=1 Tax=Fibrella aestuarina BUZ 2 TaxID=1166018 RepID=I0KBB6_9BACT|nr:hypothetical protein [Fibrella aestuarina]CCH01419.1 hypothetical protein FAES_3411 [Fibrella aestuarina BUZ 2]
MIKTLFSVGLLAISAFLSLKHGWDAFQPASAEQTSLLADLGISKAIMPYFGVFSIVIGLMLLFPQTFFISNVLNAITIVLIMALALRAGNVSLALLEIPFLAMPLILIRLTYPFTC